MCNCVLGVVSGNGKTTFTGFLIIIIIIFNMIDEMNEICAVKTKIVFVAILFFLMCMSFIVGYHYEVYTL